MLFKVEMTVNIPSSLPNEQVEEIKAKEKAYSQRLQREGKWPHIWRVVGQYANVSIFDVADNQELHEILTALPLYPWMEISVQPLCAHPSSIYSEQTSSK
ncbi:MAG: muconolactone Delta-isomerase [Leclercia sp.]